MYFAQILLIDVKVDGISNTKQNKQRKLLLVLAADSGHSSSVYIFEHVQKKLLRDGIHENGFIINVHKQMATIHCVINLNKDIKDERLRENYKNSSSRPFLRLTLCPLCHSYIRAKTAILCFQG